MPWAMQANLEGVVDWVERFETWGALHPELPRIAVPWDYASSQKQRHRLPDPSREAASHWYIDDFSADETGKWIEVGLSPDQFDLARELRDAHVVPGRLHETITDPITKQPSTVLAVAATALLHYSTVGGALDAAGYIA